jgi:hypothetical protein
MRIKCFVHLSGYSRPIIVSSEIEIEEEDLRDMSKEQIEEYLDQATGEWSAEQVEYGWEEI